MSRIARGNPVEGLSLGGVALVKGFHYEGPLKLSFDPGAVNMDPKDLGIV